jgi:hypothetical protein
MPAHEAAEGGASEVEHRAVVLWVRGGAAPPAVVLDADMCPHRVAGLPAIHARPATVLVRHACPGGETCPTAGTDGLRGERGVAECPQHVGHVRGIKVSCLRHALSPSRRPQP